MIVVVDVEMILKIVPTMDLRVPIMVADEAEVAIEAITAMIEKAAIGRVSIKVVEVVVATGGKKVVAVGGMEEGMLLFVDYKYFLKIIKFNISILELVEMEVVVEEVVGMNQALLIKIGQNHFPLMSVWKKNYLEIVAQALTSISMKIFQLKQLVMMCPLTLTQ